MEPFGRKGGVIPDHYRHHNDSKMSWNVEKRKKDLKMRREMYRSSGSPKHPYKKINKKGKRNFKFPQRRRANNEPIKPLLSPSDLEEIERKRKLSDTANKLLSKLKSWSAEDSVNDSSVKVSVEPKQSESANSVSAVSEKVNKPKRIAHSRTTSKFKKKSTVKSSSQTTKSVVRSEKYEVNKATVKDFQNRIQHKLINEIMQMPKENLQNVLNDPKINPIMEVKMSRLVKENKLLIAQRLRALAESKMTSQDIATSSQLLIDIDKLIDPVIETDLSVLPYELIQQMENIFQVQFDYSKDDNNEELQAVENKALNNSNETKESALKVLESQNILPLESTQNNFINEMNLKNENTHFQDIEMDSSNLLEEIMEFSNHENAERENAESFSKDAEERSETNQDESALEDTTFYECSTDEDENVEDNNENATWENHGNNNENVNINTELSEEGDGRQLEKYPSPREENEGGSEKPEESSNVSLSSKRESPDLCKTFAPSNLSSSRCTIESPVNSSEEVHSSYQTVSRFKTAETQTSFSNESQSVYGICLPEVTTDNNPSSLLQEVECIQNLINKLNDRRFRIFLQLAKINPNGNFLSNLSACNNFVETLSNGSSFLLESLNNFLNAFHSNPNNFRRFDGKAKHSKFFKRKNISRKN